MPPKTDTSGCHAKSQKNHKVDSGPKMGSTALIDLQHTEAGDMNTIAESSGNGGDKMEQRLFHSDRLSKATLVVGLSQWTPQECSPPLSTGDWICPTYQQG